jgi:magnesium transporter
MAMKGTLSFEGNPAPADRADVERHLQAGEFFWLDLDDVDQEVDDLLLNTFKIHPLAVEDVRHFGQRPKIDDYDNFMYMVVHGAPPTPGTTDEVHFIFAEKFLITVHRGPCAPMDAVRGRIAHHRAAEVHSPPVALIYLIIDQLVDTFFPMLNDFDNQIDELEDAILEAPTDAQLGTLFTMKRSLIGVRKLVTPERDMFASISSGVTVLPGVTDEGLRYLRDIYDHLIRISDLVDGYRDLLSGVMDTHLSTVSNRLNVVMKQLTIIATVFLPLSFLTGFFGQNFSWLVGHINGVWPFLVFGLGIELASAAGLLYLFRKRGWLGGPTN